MLSTQVHNRTDDICNVISLLLWQGYTAVTACHAVAVRHATWAASNTVTEVKVDHEHALARLNLQGTTVPTRLAALSVISYSDKTTAHYHTTTHVLYFPTQMVILFYDILAPVQC